MSTSTVRFNFLENNFVRLTNIQSVIRLRICACSNNRIALFDN